MEHNHLLLQFLLLLGAATGFATLFFHLKLPTIVGFIVSGMVIGPFGLRLVDSVPGAETLTEIGIVFLMFTIGLEFSFSKLKHLRRPFLGLGFGQVAGTLLVTALITRLLGLSWAQSVFAGCLLALSSTAIVMKMLEDSRETTTPHGGATLGVLLFQDLAVIPMMLLVPLLGGHTGDQPDITAGGASGWLMQMAVVCGLIWAAGRYVVPFLLEQVIKTRSRELFFFAILLLCFGTAVAMEASGLSLSFGAFVAGLMISESPYGRQATAAIVPMRDNFLGLFFASVGMLVDISFMLANMHWILLAIVLVIVIKSGLVYTLARALRYPTKTALITAFMVFQVGEFSFILAQSGAQVGLVDKYLLQMFLAVSVFSMMLTPFVTKWVPLFAYRGRSGTTGPIAEAVGESIISQTLVPGEAKKKKSEGRGHTIIVGFGVAGRNLAAALRSLNLPYVVIEQNYKAVQEQKKAGEHIIYGDATNEEILLHAGLEQARLVVIAAAGELITHAIADRVREIRPDVHIVIRIQYSREAGDLDAFPNTDVVVAEYETTIELLGKALMVYGVSEQDIRGFMAETRERLKGGSIGLSDYLRQQVDLPAWKMLGEIRPLVIKSDYEAVGQTIADTRLRAETGVTVIAVYRDGLGTAIPTPDFVLNAGDVLHVIGDHDGVIKAKSRLAGEQVVF